MTRHVIRLWDDLVVGWLMSKLHVSVSSRLICLHKCMCCHTETEVVDQTCCVIRLQYTDTGQTIPSTDPITPGVYTSFKPLVWLNSTGSGMDKDSTKQRNLEVCLLVGCLTSQQHASVSQGRICTDNSTCCHTEIEAADQTFHLTQSQYTDTGPTSPSADPITPGAWQGSHWSANL